MLPRNVAKHRQSPRNTPYSRINRRVCTAREREVRSVSRAAVAVCFRRVTPWEQRRSVSRRCERHRPLRINGWLRPYLAGSGAPRTHCRLGDARDSHLAVTRRAARSRLSERRRAPREASRLEAECLTACLWAPCRMRLAPASPSLSRGHYWQEPSGKHLPSSLHPTVRQSNGPVHSSPISRSSWH